MASTGFLCVGDLLLKEQSWAAILKSLLYRLLILETNRQCLIWKHSGNSFFSFQQKTSPPRKKLVKNRPNPTCIPPTLLPLISASVSLSCSLQLCKLSFKHTHTWHEPARAPWNLEKYHLYSLCCYVSFRKVKQVSLKPWWTWWVAHLFGLWTWLPHQK